MRAIYQPHAAGLLAPLEPWFQDPTVSEIVLNQPGEIYVERAQQFERILLPEFNSQRLWRLFQLIANENQQELNAEKPLLSANLPDNARIQIVLPPVSQYPIFAIRRQVLHSICLAHYAKTDFYRYATVCDLSERLSCSREEAEQRLFGYYQQQAWHDFLCLAIALKKNIVISGGTSSGKTTFLNACLQQIPLSERMILLEDTREIIISHPNHVRLICSKGDQGLAKVSMQELVQCCLRLRPDRIIIGEIRGKEIVDFIGACATGHSGSVTSIHASDPQVALMRMTQLYKQNNVPAMSDDDIHQEIHAVVDVIIQLHKTKNGRFVQSVYYKAAHHHAY